MVRKSTLFLVIMNALHGLTHLVQMMQSGLLILASGEHLNHNHSFLDKPGFHLAMGLVAILTLVFGIRDFIHHYKHKD